MAIAYDFDMFSIMPKELQAQFGEMFSDLGMTDAVKEQRALFRDPAAVAALQGASDEVKQCLIDSGFGINVYDSGAGPGRFPPSDENARFAVLGRLRQNLKHLPEDADWNGFDIRAFLKAAAQALPIDTPARSLTEMRAMPTSGADAASTPVAAPQAEAQAGGQSMDDFFSGTPVAPRPPAPTASMDDFFSARPSDTPAQRKAPEPAPDMDSFFSNAPAPSADAATPPRMTAEDVRLSIDTAPPRKIGFGPVKMGLMVLGLLLIVSMLSGGGGMKEALEVATGTDLLSVRP